MNQNKQPNLSDLISLLPSINNFHDRSSLVYIALDRLSKEIIRNSEALNSPKEIEEKLEIFGNLFFPYTKMGAIDSLDLFGLDELIIFSFYWKNRNRYMKSADIGANIGLHSIIMSKCGWNVCSYEPDPIHVSLIKRNLSLNKISNVNLYEAAVSNTEGQMDFIRVLGNTTGSHLAGAKSNPYGDLVKFSVKVIPIKKIMELVDFIKMDVEGQEAIIIQSTTKSDWDNLDMMVEVGTQENASIILEHLNKIQVNCFSQKNSWSMVKDIKDMPNSYKEGSLFISSKVDMPW